MQTDDVYGKNNISLMDRLLSRITPIEYLIVMTKAVRNWYDLVFFRLGFKKEIIIVLKSGSTYEIKNNADYFKFMYRTKNWALELAEQMKPTIQINKNTVVVKTSGRKVTLYHDSPTSLGSSLVLALEQFIREQYSWLDVKDKVVVDIGASIGDTPIYFALKGAKHVYAVEPLPISCEIAKKNIMLNGLGSKITVLNAALGKKQGFIKIKTGDEVITDAMFLKEEAATQGKRIQMLTLGSIVKKYKIKNAILKMDCEGCEYETLLNAKSEVLNCFNQILIEYHFGYLNLEKAFRRMGFEVTHKIPKYSGYGDPYNSLYNGLLFATKEAKEN